jgi:putative spermidine/putrescine transport system substrate-binding protein
MKRGDRKRISRREFLYGSGALALASVAGFPAILKGGRALAAEIDKPVTMGIWGGSLGAAAKKTFVPMFEKKYSVKVNVIEAWNNPRLTQLKIQKNSPQMDVAFFTDQIIPTVNASGVTEKINPAAIPNLKFSHPKIIAPGGNFIIFQYGAWGLVYNADRIKTKPSSWSDLLDAKYKGKLTSPDISYSSSYITLVAMARLGGGDENNLEPGFQNVKTLRGLSPTFWTQDHQLDNMMKQEEVWMSSYFSGNSWSLTRRQGLKAAQFADPKEGSYLVGLCMTKVANGPNPKGADLLMNMILDPEAQAAYSAEQFTAPANMESKLSAELKEMVPYGDKVEKLNFANWGILDSKKDAIAERWMKEIR